MTQQRLEPGTQLDHYRVLRFLSSGGMGEVYLARDLRLHRKVALKLIHAEQLRTPRVREHFLFEAQATAQFNHPHIVTIYGIGSYEDNLYMALEYLEGETLRERLQQEELSVTEALRIAISVAQALDAAHGQQLLHRDLKPANVFLSRDGRVRILDLGLAQHFRLDWEPTRSGLADRLVEAPTASFPELDSARSLSLLTDSDTTPTHDSTALSDDKLAVTSRTDQGETREQRIDPDLTHPAQAPPLQPPKPSLATTLAQQASAQAGETAPSRLLCGTPFYMSPEQWQSTELGPASDVWTFGIVLFEMLTGQRPFPNLPLMEYSARVMFSAPASIHHFRKDLPERLVTMLHACLQREPEQRPEMQDIVHTLQDLWQEQQLPKLGDQHPFRGLRAFDEGDARFFFGRDGEINAFLERLREESILPVVGPSGSGKSSFVNAGILPRLQARAHWSVFTLRPGRQPFAQLAAKLLKRGWIDLPKLHERISTWEKSRLEQPAIPDIDKESLSHYQVHHELTQQLRRFPELLAWILFQQAEQRGERIVVVIDQLEELYTLVHDEKTRKHWMQSILGISDDRQDPIRLIFTLRDDFLGRLAESTVARNALLRITMLAKPNPSMLQDILHRPLQLVGYRYDSEALPQRMAQEVEDEPSALPLLQFALAQLWEQRDKQARLLREDTYLAMGGVAGALAQHAETILKGLSPEHLDSARALLLRLVTPEHTRQILSRTRLLQGLPTSAHDVLNLLVNARLLSLRQGHQLDQSETEVELAHESLIQNWSLLTRWLDESREEHHLLDELHQAAMLWERRGQRSDEVWQGQALYEAHKALERSDEEIAAPIQNFLEAGLKRDKERQRRHQFLRLSLATALVLVALGSTIFALVFFSQKQKVEQQRSLSRQRLAAVLVEGARSARLQGQKLQAYAKLRSAMELEWQTTQELSSMSRSLWWLLNRSALLWSKTLTGSLYHLAVDPKGRYAAVASSEKSVYLIDIWTQQVRGLRYHKDQILAVVFSPDGRWIASSDRSGDVWLWNRQTQQARKILSYLSPVWSLRFHPKRNVLAVGLQRGSVHLFDIQHSTQRSHTLKHPSAVWDIRFSPDGRHLALSQRQHEITIWNPAQKSLLTLTGVKRRWQTVAFHPTKPWLAAGGQKGAMALWDWQNNRVIRRWREHRRLVYDLAFSKDGRFLASASWDRKVKIWSPTQAHSLKTFRGHKRRVFRVRFTPDSKRLLSLSTTGRRLIMWGLHPTPPSTSTVPHGREHTFAFHPTRPILASGGSSAYINLWDTDTGKHQQSFQLSKGGLWHLLFHPNGKWLISAGRNANIQVWNLRTGQPQQVLFGHHGDVMRVALHPNGQWLASAGRDTTVKLWTLNQGKAMYTLKGHGYGVLSLAFHPNGQWLASGSWDNTIRLWDLKTQRTIQVLRGHKGGIWQLLFHPTKAWMFSVGEDGKLLKWDTKTWRPQRLGQQRGRFYDMVLSNDQQHLLTSNADGTLRQWNIESGAQRIQFRQKGEIGDIALAPKRRLLTFERTNKGMQLLTLTKTQSFPHWRTPYLHLDPPTLLSHRGWQAFSSSTETVKGKKALWKKPFAGAPVLHASRSPDGTTLCLLRSTRQLEFWEIHSAQKRWTRRLSQGVKQTLASSQGCTVMGERGQTHFHDAQGSRVIWLKDARRLAHHPFLTTAVWLATNRALYTITKKGKVERIRDIDPGLTAIQTLPKGLALGFKTGKVMYLPYTNNRRGFAPPLWIEQTSLAPVTHVAAGPNHTLFLGNTRGEIGHWELTHGRRLYHKRLASPISQLTFAKHTLYIATERGHTQAWDLRPLLQSACQSLRQVWTRIPVTWSQGQLTRRSPPKLSGCQPHPTPQQQ